MPIAAFRDDQVHFEVVDGEGDPVVMLHGMFRDGDAWRTAGYVDALAAVRTVVLVDALGHGRSSRPAAPSAYAADAQADAVTAVLDAVGIHRAVLWGYSMGGWIAAAAAAAAPDRVQGLIIGGWDVVGGITTAFAPAGSSSMPVDAWFSWLLRQARKDPVTRAAAAEPEAARLRGCFDALRRTPGDPAVVTTLGRRAVLYCGARDPYRDAMRLLATGADAGWAELAGLGHATAFDRADRVLPALEPHLATLFAASPG